MSDYVMAGGPEGALYLVQSAVGGLVAVLVGALMYFITRYLDKMSSRRDVAYILKDEVTKMAYIALSEDRTTTGMTVPAVPDGTVYRGLLHTGNIRYVPHHLWKKLDSLYSDFNTDKFEFDPDLYIYIIKELESVQRRFWNGPK
ncbi:MAG: hypothetical protein MPI95_01060 [Nitrosopumilus sp.]|nr:hypothetical protein [Nitrosopumilus sp.]MDA7952698.1 hypothetical protein [Nitrosopumilus sp.]MDA7957669.1 hypothetical protein [Nitrosopumilus sp.]MDA7998443.1 hypothetical protein [Nitrosopumilus sp.]